MAYLKSHVAGTIADHKVEGYKRWQAVQSLEKPPEDSLPTAELEESAKSLAKTLLQKDADRFVRLGAAGSLGKLASVAGKIGAAALALVLRREEDVNLRRRAAASLGEFGSEVGVLGVQSLTGALTADADEHVRWRAAESIGRLGPAAGESGAEALAKALREDKDPGVRLRAAAALGALGGFAGDVGAAAVAEALGDVHGSVRDSAKEALEQLREGALRTLMEPIHGYARGRAAWALGQLGTRAGAEGTRALAAVLLLESDAYVRHRCVEALEKLGASIDGLAVAAVEKAAAEDSDVYVQIRASELSSHVADLGIAASESDRAELEELLKSQAQVFLDLQQRMPNFDANAVQSPPASPAASAPKATSELPISRREAAPGCSFRVADVSSTKGIVSSSAVSEGDASGAPSPTKSSRGSGKSVGLDDEVSSLAKTSRGSGKSVCLDDEAQVVEVEVEVQT